MTCFQKGALNLKSAELRTAICFADLAAANLSKNLTRSQREEAQKNPSTILPAHLQQSRSVARRRGPNLQPTRATRTTEENGVIRPSCSKRQVWIVGVALAALLFAGVVWKPINRAIWLAQLDQRFRTPEQLLPVPTTRLGNARVPSGAPQIFATSPKTDLKEPTAVSIPTVRSEDFLPDPTPTVLSSVEGSRNAIAPRTAKLRKLPPVAKIRKLRVRVIAKVPVDTDVYRFVGIGRGATVIASYYGREFAGRRTASGEKFNPSGMTAAHRTLPLGTRVEVTHARNGRSVIVRINDRGPYIKGRSIDLSAGAARAIGLGGLGRVHLSIVR